MKSLQHGSPLHRVLRTWLRTSAARSASRPHCLIALRRAGAVFAACAALATLAGCGVGSVGVLQTGTPAGGAKAGLTGRIHGGQQPVAGAAVRLYTPGTGGYGKPATSVLTGAGFVLTDANGGFSITGDYTCPSPTAQMYLVATGGNAGSGTPNTGIALAAALGSCQTLTPATYVQVNELTTVAAAYALSGFGTSATQISSSGSAAALQGLANAFQSAATLVSSSSGDVPPPASRHASLPVATIYSLGNILASCVNSSGSTSSNCQTLFKATTPANGTAPTDTFQAAMNLAKAPSQNAGTLFGLASSSPPFAPGLTTAPADWTLALTYTGGGLNVPQALAADANGNLWIVNVGNTVTELAAGTGAYLSGANGYTGLGLDAPSGVAIDTNGNVWIGNCGDACSQSGSASFLTELTSAGVQVSGSPFSGGGLAGAYAIGVDGANGVWLANVFGGSLSKFTSSGAGSSGFPAAGFQSPLNLAIDASGSVWTVAPVASSVTKFSNAGASAAGPFTGGGLNYPEALAIDHTGSVWIANHDGNSLVVLSNAGSILSGTAGYSGGGLAQPNALAIDGSGSVFVADGVSNGGLSVFTNAGIANSAASGYVGNGGLFPNGVAVDGSGNVWMTDCGSYCSGAGASPGSVIEFIGLASPVVTPLATGVATNSLGTLP